MRTIIWKTDWKFSKMRFTTDRNTHKRSGQFCDLARSRNCELPLATKVSLFPSWSKLASVESRRATAVTTRSHRSDFASCKFRNYELSYWESQSILPNRSFSGLVFSLVFASVFKKWGQIHTIVCGIVPNWRRSWLLLPFPSGCSVVIWILVMHTSEGRNKAMNLHLTPHHFWWRRRSLTFDGHGALVWLTLPLRVVRCSSENWRLCSQRTNTIQLVIRTSSVITICTTNSKLHTHVESIQCVEPSWIRFPLSYRRK